MNATESQEDTWEINDPGDRIWDVVVVGTGMGGAVTGFALANQGLDVLFIEKGEFLHKSLPADSGDGAIARSRSLSANGAEEGKWPHKIAIKTNLGQVELSGVLGCGSGGSTITYGCVLERMAPMDFKPGGCFADFPGSSLPSVWPVSYEEMRPYYRKAERLFRVRGTPDPIYDADAEGLIEPPGLNSKDKAVFEHLRDRGLHPYRLHLGSELHPDCEYCPGVCRKQCRNDAAKICIVPALKTGRAKFLGNCTVTRLEANDSSVSSVVCERQNSTINIRGRVIVLAAGAYGSPAILLNSASETWPQGLANASGMVGRNLMMHTTDFFAIWPRGMGSRDDFSRTVALKDLYVVDGVKLGMIQSSGIKGNWGLVLGFLRDYCDRHPTWWSRLVRPTLPLVAVLGTMIFNRSVIMATVVEDLPYEDNRVIPDQGSPGGFRVEYEYKEELKQRNELLRAAIRKRFGKHRVAFMLQRENNLNWGHPCGTCRFGDDPATSVVDRNNKAHGVDNLYVVDGSFFPSSSGVNPSLTISANALRVADVIADELVAR